MKVKIIFKWFDFWVGLFIDTKKKTLYFFPVPMLGLEVKYGESPIKNELQQTNVSNWVCKYCGCEHLYEGKNGIWCESCLKKQTVL